MKKNEKKEMMDNDLKTWNFATKLWCQSDVDPIGTCPRKPRNYELDYKTRKLKEKLEEDNDQETRNPNKHTFQKTLDILNPTPNGNRLKNSKYRTQESINPLCQVVSSQEYKIASTLTKWFIQIWATSTKV